MTSQVLHATPSVAASGAGARSRGGSRWWLLGFALFQFACQLALLVPWFGDVRVVVRVAAFAASIGLLVFLPQRGRAAPVKYWAYVVLGVLLLEFLHPDGNLLAGVAQFALYLAIMGPLFWVGRLEVTPQTVQRLFFILWAFYTASALLGVLQAYFPGHFQPALSSIYALKDKGLLTSLEIQLASGEHVFRPMGLTDAPGGAAYGAVYAVLLGLGILQSRKLFVGARVLAVVSMVLGMVCLYLCQVRAALVMLAVCVLVLIALAAMSGNLSRFLLAACVVGVAVPLAFVFAVSLGGHSVTDRLATLLDGDPTNTYYKSRGKFLEFTIDELLPRFPLGAGLGRWGMINHYFGSRSGSIYVEIQWTGWLLDGGLLMIFAYPALILATIWRCFRLAIGRHASALGVWPAVVVAYNVGALALCFSYVEFIGTSGLEFWLLNAAVLAAASQRATLADPASSL